MRKSERHRVEGAVPGVLAVADLLTRFAERPDAATARTVVDRLTVLAEPGHPSAPPEPVRRRYALLRDRWSRILGSMERGTIRRRVRWGNPFARREQ